MLAGAAGIEPANAGIKSRCLTAWRRPTRIDGFDYNRPKKVLLGALITRQIDNAIAQSVQTYVF
jgi:hypothetical protein